MTTKEHLSKHDREVAAIRLLLRQGMHLLVKVQQENDRTAQNLTRLERKVEAFIDSMQRGGGNGHAKGKVDLQ